MGQPYETIRDAQGREYLDIAEKILNRPLEGSRKTFWEAAKDSGYDEGRARARLESASYDAYFATLFPPSP